MGGSMDRQRGNALIIVLLILSVAGAYLALSGLSAVQDKSRRDQGTQAALAQAKEALIGYAATYRDSHSSEVFGYLPCPDTNNDGTADAPCGGGDVSVIGRLPWKTLGLPPLRDSAGECLWYAVSGRVKNSPKSTTAALNWDTLGQFLLKDPAGNLLTGASAHDRPLAVIIAPGSVIGAQTRPSAGNTECGGSNVIAAYLDGKDPIYGGAAPAAAADSTLTLATTDSVRSGTNNDQAQWITADDIFNRVRRRSDFGNDVKNLLDDLKACLDSAASPPSATGSKGFDSVFTYITTAGNCPGYWDTTSLKNKILNHWRSNLLYAQPAAAATVNSQPCKAVLLFGGARISGQTRASSTDIDNAAKYLEAPNAAAFTSNTGYVAGTSFSAATPGADLARCITGVPPGAISFANNFSSFAPAGAGVTLDATHQTVTVVDSAGAAGGCAWYPLPLPLAGKTLRAYYRYTFLYSDDHALTGKGTDRGNGFTFELVRADFRDLSPASPTPLCGKEDDMGALTTTYPGTAADLALHSIIIESDVHEDNKDQDPSGNHTAIMVDGNLAHSLANGNATTACNASVQGCAHTPANKFEELPTPASHNQRIEIATGCNSTCSACTPATHGAINKYARIRVWVDCTDCANTTIDLSASPNMQRCIELYPQLNSAYFGFTGGFQSGGPSSQGVTLQDFIILSQ